MSEANTRTCSRCGRPFNRVFPKCPFCGTPVAAVVQATRHDYPAMAEKSRAAQEPMLRLEFHPAAVRSIDLFFDITWGSKGLGLNDAGWQPSPGQQNAVLGFGLIFGEILCRAFRGKWQDHPEQPDNPGMGQVVLPGNTTVLPAALVFRRLKIGAEESLEAFYTRLAGRLQIQPDPREIDGWLRQARCFEDVRRPDLALSFYEKALTLSPGPEQRRSIERLRREAEEASRKQADEEKEHLLAESRQKVEGWTSEGRQALAAAGVRVDGGTPTLVAADLFLDEILKPAPGVALPRWRPEHTIEVLGAFLGKWLCARFGGKWQEDPYRPANGWQVVWPSGLAVGPFSLVESRIQGGVSLLEKMAELTRQLAARGDAVDPPENPADWFAQASAFAEKKPPRLDRAVHFASLGLRFAGGDTLERRLQLAAWCRARGRLDEATAHVDAALKGNSAAGAAWRERARLCLLRGDAPAAEDAAQQSLSGEGSLEGLLLLAEAQEARKKTEPALEAYERALQHEPWSREALLGKGRALAALGRHAEALEWLEIFIGRGDCEPERTFLAARCADAAGRMVEAHRFYRNSLNWAQLGEERRSLAQSRIRDLALLPEVRLAEIEAIGDLEQAVAAYRQFNSDFPDRAEPWKERGVGLAMLNRTDEALTCLEQAACLEPGEAKSYDHMAVCLMRAGRHPEALAILEKGLRSCPRSGLLLSRRGIVLAGWGRNEEALACFEEAVQADPGYEEAWAFKGDVESRLGKTEQAIRSLRRYLERKKGSGEKRVRVVRQQLLGLENPGRQWDEARGRALFDQAFGVLQQGTMAQALALFQQAVEEDPLCGEFWLNRGTCLFHLGRMEESLASYCRAEELSGFSTPILKGKVACLVRLGRGEEAVGCFDSIPKGSLSKDVLTLQATTLVRAGRPKEALRIYDRMLARWPEEDALRQSRAALLIRN